MVEKQNRASYHDTSFLGNIEVTQLSYKSEKLICQNFSKIMQ